MMFPTYCGLVSFITAGLICFPFVSGEKFRFCAVDGKGHIKKTTNYCPVLNRPESKVQCVIGEDRLDCLRKISKKQADFGVFTSEDLVTASNSAVELLVTNELRFNEARFEYEVVAVFDKKAGIKNRHDLQDKRFCHPGYGYESDWTRILSNYLEASVVPQNCQPELTLTENRIKSSSEFFSSACKAGPWVQNSTLDMHLKRKYPNLCASCDSPMKCSKEDKYWGRRGSLFCLTDGSGDISFSRWDDIQVHFGLVPGNKEASSEGYNMLCPDDTIRPLNSSNPCVWVVKPWSVVATQRSKSQDIQDMLSHITSNETAPWQTALLNLMESYYLTLKALTPIDPIETYLDKATGFQSANSFSGCHPPRTVRLCTTSIIENAKCSWLREALNSYGIEPDLDCLKADNTTHCMEAVHKNYADVVIIGPDQLNNARKFYELKTLLYETVDDDNKYAPIGVSKKEFNFDSFSSTYGAKVCFPTYDGFAWNIVARLLMELRLTSTCPFDQGIFDFYGKSCIPGLPENISTFSSCNGEDNNKYMGEDGALSCLLDGVGDVAFVSKSTFNNFLSDSTKNKNNYTLGDFEIIGQDKFKHSWAPIGQVMIRQNTSNLWMKDTLDVFLAMNDLFGKDYKTSILPFTLFGPFNGKSDLIFHDKTIRLRTKPTARNIDDSYGEYEALLNVDCSESSSSSKILLSQLILLCCIFSYFR